MTYIPSTTGAQSTPPTTNAQGGSGSQMPYDPNGNMPNLPPINWNQSPDQILKQIESEWETLVNWLQSNPKNMYNGGLAMLDFLINQVGPNMAKLGPLEGQLQAFFNTQFGSGGNSTLMGQAVAMAAEGEAVMYGQSTADAWLNQLTQQLAGLKGLGATFNTMYMEAAYLNMNNQAGLNNWISQNQVTYTDQNGNKVTYWINPQTGAPMSNFSFSDWANAAAYPLGTLINSGNTTQYINSLYQSEIQQILDKTKGNPWERMMELLALVEGRMDDLGRQMNGLSGNLDSLTKANQDVADMQNMLKNPTPANMKQFYADFNDLQSIISTDPMLSSLEPNLNSVLGIFNGNTVPFPVGQDGKTPIPFTPWSVSAGLYNLPQNVVVEVTINGKTQYEEWDGTNINVSSNANMSGATPIKSSTGDIQVADGTTFCISPTDGPNGQSSANITYGVLQGLGDYNDISANLTNLINPANPQTSYTTTTASNNANTISSLQTYFNSIAQPTQQMYSTDSSNYQTMESAFAQFLQSFPTQEQTMNTAMASAGS